LRIRLRSQVSGLRLKTERPFQVSGKEQLRVAGSGSKTKEYKDAVKVPTFLDSLKVSPPTSFSVIPALGRCLHPRKRHPEKALLQQKATKDNTFKNTIWRGTVELFPVRWSFTASSSWIPAFAGMTATK